MTRRVGIVVAWLVATFVAIGIAATAVGSVRGQVTDVPAIPTAGTAALLETTTTVASTTNTAPASAAETSTTTTTNPGAGGEPTTTTTTLSSSSATTTTRPPPPTTTTTVAPADPEVKTYQLVGGQVTISVLAPNVTLVGAVPSAGFSAEVEDSGPEEVRVDFESSEHKSSFRAEWEDEGLEVDIDEESEEEEESEGD